MPLGLLVVSTLVALAAAIAWRSYQERRRPRADAAVSGGTLVAIVYPEEVDRVAQLFAAIDFASEEVIVLAIHRSSNAAPGIQRLLQERDPRLVGAVAGVAAGVGRPVALMSASGPDPARVALDTARKLVAERMVAFATREEGAEEQRRRCVSAWESLGAPRPALHVDLIVPGDAPVTVDLAARG